MLTRALLKARTLTSTSSSEKEKTVLGKPLLFPVTFTHTRLTPVKDKFINRFLLVGVPVGIECRAGNLLAIDDKTLQDVSPPPGGGDVSLWRRIAAHCRCWFSVDAVRLLHRGDYGVGLREKLDSFLRDQSEDPSQWPHAYALTVPKFFGFSRNVVSWWYLYNEDRELDALILEINNSYDEKRNIFLRLKGSSESDKTIPSLQPALNVTDIAEYLDDANLIPSVSPLTKSKFYSGTWRKKVFASPFEKVDGLVSQRMMDPLSPSAWTATSFSNMTTLEETGEVRMATRLTCAGPPIDPASMRTWALVAFLLRWTVPGIFTTAEIVVKALKIKFSGKMKMNKKPPVRSGSVGRHISPLELAMEPFFRAHLSDCVQSYPHPIHVTYLPCRSFTNEVIHMRSPSSLGKNASSIRNLTIEPTDPGFYTRFPSYLDFSIAVDKQTRHLGYNADPTAARLLTSDLPLLKSILVYTTPGKENEFITTASRKHRTLLHLARGFSGMTPMDSFILSSADPLSQRVYIASIIRLSAARIFAFNSTKLLSAYTFGVTAALQWVMLIRGLL
ncbi:hypothetical protein BJX70DRAFT_406077 [Aspergillus crustosus]